MNPFLRAKKAGLPVYSLDAKGVLGYIEWHALPRALDIAAGAEALEASRPSAATARRAGILRRKAEAFMESASLHRKNLSLSGLLDDYLREQQEFRTKFEPAPSSHGTTPTGPFHPARPLPEPTPPSTVRFFAPVGAADRFRFCQILKTFDKTARFSEATTDAVDAFKTLLETYPENQRDNIIEYIESYCPMPDFFYNLVGGRRKAPSTPPYQVPGTKPVPTADVYPRKQPVPEVPRYVPPTAPPVPSFQRMPSPLPAAPAPVQSSVPFPTPSKESGMAPQCPSGQFWDGRMCRGSVSALPTIPGGAVATVSPGLPAGPGITMGNIFLLGRNGCKSGSCRT